MRHTIFNQWMLTAGAIVAVAALILGAPVLGEFGTAAAQPVIRGQLDYDLGYSPALGEVNENRLSYRLDVEANLGFDGKVHIGWDGHYDHLADRATLELDEAYVDVYLHDADLRLGRQIVSWGTADGLNPTSVINPRAPLSLSMDELSAIPVPALQTAYYLPGGGSITGVLVTDFVPAPDGLDTLQAIAGQIADELPSLPGVPDFAMTDPAPVSLDGSQFQFALRGEAFVANHNVYVTYYTGWDHNPVAWLEVMEAFGREIPIAMKTQYRKTQKFGLATAGTWRDAGVWTELSYTMPEKVAELDGDWGLSGNDAYVEAVVGGDYTFANGVMLTGQLVYYGAGSLTNPYKEPGEDVDPQTYLISAMRYAPQPGHNVELVGLANLGDRGILTLAKYTYDINQVTKVSVGLSKVFADGGDEFAHIKDMAEAVTVGLSVSF